VKKLVAIVLLLVYGLSSSGMTIQFHYCCGKLKNIKLSPVTVKPCGMKHAFSKKPCCDDRQVELKLKADQKAEQATKFVFSVPTVSKQEAGVFILHPMVRKTILPEIFAPPPLKAPLYILHSVYRI
jgi:hypothetical protein